MSVDFHNAVVWFNSSVSVNQTVRLYVMYWETPTPVNTMPTGTVYAILIIQKREKCKTFTTYDTAKKNKNETFAFKPLWKPRRRFSGISGGSCVKLANNKNAHRQQTTNSNIICNVIEPWQLLKSDLFLSKSQRTSYLSKTRAIWLKDTISGAYFNDSGRRLQYPQELIK